jgi:4-amino-4-deoxy-L-arabinose transferase-like glycosyltransferase
VPMMRRYSGRIWLITLAGLVVRLALIAYQPLWRDEAFTALAVQRPLGSMLTVVRHDSAPPLFYLLERIVAIVSTSPAALRILPVLAGVAAIPIIAALGRRVAGDTGGTWAAVIGAVAPALLVSSLDARMYMLATTLVLASTLSLLRALERPSVLRWALYAGLSILAVYTVYFALFAVLAQVIAVAILTARRHPGTTLLVGAIGLVTLVSLTPWVIVASSQLSHGTGGFWVPKLSVLTLSGGLVQFFNGPPISTWVTGYIGLRIIEGAAVAAGVVALAAVAFSRGRLRQDEVHAASLLGLTGGIGVALIILVSFWHPLEDGRYFSDAWAPLFPLVGAGLALLPWRRVTFAAAAVTAVVGFATIGTVTNPDTPAAIAALEHSAGPNDVIAAYPSEYLLVLYYGDHAIDVHTRSMASTVPWFWGTAVYPLGAVLQSMPMPSPTTHNVYYVFEPGDPPPPDPDSYSARSTRCWSGVCVTMLTPSGVSASGANST